MRHRSDRCHIVVACRGMGCRGMSRCVVVAGAGGCAGAGRRRRARISGVRGEGEGAGGIQLRARSGVLLA